MICIIETAKYPGFVCKFEGLSLSFIFEFKKLIAMTRFSSNIFRPWPKLAQSSGRLSLPISARLGGAKPVERQNDWFIHLDTTTFSPFKFLIRGNQKTLGSLEFSGYKLDGFTSLNPGHWRFGDVDGLFQLAQATLAKILFPLPYILL